MLAPNETVQHLQAARNLIADPAKWCQGSWDTGEGQYCASGALRQFGGGYDKPAYQAVSRAARELYGSSILGVNDGLGHKAILRCFDRAIQNELAATGEP